METVYTVNKQMYTAKTKGLKIIKVKENYQLTGSYLLHLPWLKTTIVFHNETCYNQMNNTFPPERKQEGAGWKSNPCLEPLSAVKLWKICELEKLRKMTLLTV